MERLRAAATAFLGQMRFAAVERTWTLDDIDDDDDVDNNFVDNDDDIDVDDVNNDIGEDEDDQNDEHEDDDIIRG